MHDTPEELIDGLFADRAIIVNIAPVEGDSQLIHNEPVTSRTDDSVTISLMLGQNMFNADPVEGLHTESVCADGRVSIAQFEDRNQAIGAYFSTLEVHGISENEANTQLEYRAALDDFRTHLSEWSVSDRRQYVLDGVEHGSDPRLERTRAEGSFRSTGEFSTGEEPIVDALLANSVRDPGNCYETALTALENHLDSSRVAYAEGVALSKYGGTIQEHAWIEVDGDVVEPTWPWHSPTPPKDAIYYGFTMNARDVYETTHDRGYYGTVIAERDELLEYLNSNF